MRAHARCGSDRPGGSHSRETRWKRPGAHGPRPSLAGLALILLTALLLLALAATTLLIGSRLTAQVDRGPTGRLAVAPVIPHGRRGAVRLHLVELTRNRPATSSSSVRTAPKGGASRPTRWTIGRRPGRPTAARLAFYSGDEDSVQLRVASADGLISLADAPGCWSPTSQAPAWSPDGRFIAYVADRDPDDDTCDVAFADVFVVSSDGSGTPRRLLADADTRYSASPAWHDDRIALRASPPTTRRNWCWSRVTDPEQPWGLEAEAAEGAKGAGSRGAGPAALGPRRKCLGGRPCPLDFGYGMANVVSVGGTSPLPLWTGPEEDVIVPGWSPDGTWLSMLVLRRQLSDYGVYGLAFASADGSEPRLIETLDLTGNGGPAMISPDGTRLLVRAPRGAMPGDVAGRRHRGRCRDHGPGRSSGVASTGSRS